MAICAMPSTPKAPKRHAFPSGPGCLLSTCTLCSPWCSQPDILPAFRAVRHSAHGGWCPFHSGRPQKFAQPADHTSTHQQRRWLRLVATDIKHHRPVPQVSSLGWRPAQHALYRTGWGLFAWPKVPSHNYFTTASFNAQTRVQRRTGS